MVSFKVHILVYLMRWFCHNDTPWKRTSSVSSGDSLYSITETDIDVNSLYIYVIINTVSLKILQNKFPGNNAIHIKSFLEIMREFLYRVILNIIIQTHKL